MLQRRGIPDDAQVDELADGELLLAAISAAFVQGQLATGEGAGKRVRRVLPDPAESLRSGLLCFAARAFSLHAATRIDADDRAGLERLDRYIIRPPLAAGRLQIIDELGCALCPEEIRWSITEVSRFRRLSLHPKVYARSCCLSPAGSTTHG